MSFECVGFALQARLYRMTWPYEWYKWLALFISNLDLDNLWTCRLFSLRRLYSRPIWL